MKTLVVISDTHGCKSSVEKLYEIFSENDYVIHLGDTSSDAQDILQDFPYKTIVLNGNCDLSKYGDDELTIRIENVNVFMCHGHKYGVKQNLSRLAHRAKELGCSVALYGHTHVPNICEIDGVTLINPGTMNRYSTNTYCYLVVNGNNVVAKIVELI